MNLLDINANQWIHLQGDGNFDYPIDYWGAVTSARDDGHIDLLFRWEPNCYCHFHKHLVDTTSLVIQGELHVVDIDKGKEVGRRVRKTGDYAHKPAGDIHMEFAGPDGALVLYNLHAPDGKLFEMLDKDENTILTVTADDIISGQIGG